MHSVYPSAAFYHTRWVPGYLQGEHCRSNYATDDIFFLEVCTFNQICSNGDELWQLEVGQERQLVIQIQTKDTVALVRRLL